MRFVDTAIAQLPTVRDIMQPTLVTLSSTMSLETAGGWLTRHHVSGAPVMDAAGKIVGVASLYDLVAHSARSASLPSPFYGSEVVPDDVMRAYLEDFYNEEEARVGTVADVMSTQLHTIEAASSLIDLVKALNEARIHRMLVTDGPDVVGIVSTTDVMNVVPRLVAMAAR